MLLVVSFLVPQTLSVSCPLPSGVDSHDLVQSLWIEPGEAAGISLNNALCFLSNPDPKAQLQPPTCSIQKLES